MVYELQTVDFQERVMDEKKKTCTIDHENLGYDYCVSVYNTHTDMISIYIDT